MARDLEADLAICEAATPGPWRYENESYGIEVVSEPYADASVIGVKGSSYATVDLDEADGLFIAQAREGWPYAIRRAMEAEDEVDKLRSELGTLRDVLNGRRALWD